MQVYESGAAFDPMVLDITDADLDKTVQLGIKRIAAACLALNYPTLASIPHSVVNGYKNVLAVAVETDYTFPLAEKVCCLYSVAGLQSSVDLLHACTHALLQVAMKTLCVSAESNGVLIHGADACKACICSLTLTNTSPLLHVDHQLCLMPVCLYLYWPSLLSELLISCRLQSGLRLTF